MENGFYYLVKEEFFLKFSNNGSSFKYNKGGRPTYCCFEDNKYKGLFWAIPTSTLLGKDLHRIESFLSADESDIRHSYYHIGYTNRKALFCISSAFPIIDKYILRAYTTNGIPLELKREKQKTEIKKKLLKILTYENQFPNKLESHITDIKSVLLEELGYNKKSPQE